MNRYSRPITDLQEHYDVVVVGSGYGGGIAASRLARARKSDGTALSVCLLERGKEWLAGDFPKTASTALGELQASTTLGHEGPPTGLFDFHFDDDIAVLRGCGLGGTSLINANVALKADPRVFEDPSWPKALRDDLEGGLARGYELATTMLASRPYPEGTTVGDQAYPELAKYKALKLGGDRLGQRLPVVTYYPPLNVNWTVDGKNHVGVEQKPCNLCGDCVSGCNHQAKNTTAMNYLPDAYNHGAQIFCEVRVDSVEKKAGRYLVHYAPLDVGREGFDASADLFVSADLVILAAGSLGSTEILLRSQQNGLAASSQVGARFTGNGDALGFSYNSNLVINSLGAGVRDPAHMSPAGPGPCIVGVIDARGTEKLEDGYVIEDGSAPGALGELLNLGLPAAEIANGEDTAPGISNSLRRAARVLSGELLGPYHGAIHHTESFLSMSNDNGEGRMLLDEAGRLRISWPRVGEQEIFNKVAEGMRDATAAQEGIFIRNPMWTQLQRHPLITVHPLGGCVMGESASSGVVNHKCQVYTGAGDEVHAGLYVADGAVLPRPVGVNPLFTISAVAERAMAILASERGWQIDYTLPSAPKTPIVPSTAIGVRFTESMKGFFSTNERSDYQAGFKAGEEANSDFAFVLTIEADDVDAMLADKRHRCRLAGTVRASKLSDKPLTVSGGAFELFSPDESVVGTTNMWYRMRLTDENEQSYWFEGFKVVHDHGHGLLDGWPDTTTLYITLWKGENALGELVGKGILRIAPTDFARQLTTMQAVGGTDKASRLKALARFGEFFVGSLWHTYGGIAAPYSYFNPDAPARHKRELRAPRPTVYPVKTGDGKTLRLTRYQGGKKGPLLVIHGLGVSSLINSIDTVDTNLVEFFAANGYDVWLLDWRASIALPYTEERWSGDSVAQYDHPAAVARVLEITGAKSLQVLPHCVGSLTFFMAMLSGLEGVRSIGVSQVSCHPIGGALVQLKSYLHLPEVMSHLGVSSIDAYTDTHANWPNRLFDAFVGLYPLPFNQQCDSPVCHRISFLYNLLYQHERLNQATHDALHEMFGSGNVEVFAQLGLMNRHGTLLGADGSDRYLPNYERLKLPIRFVTGAQNITFTPAANRATCEWLTEKNGPGLYDFHEVPGYGHIDCLFGKDAVADVFPLWLEHFEKTANDQ